MLTKQTNVKQVMDLSLGMQFHNQYVPEFHMARRTAEQVSKRFETKSYFVGKAVILDIPNRQ